MIWCLLSWGNLQTTNKDVKWIELNDFISLTSFAQTKTEGQCKLSFCIMFMFERLLHHKMLWVVISHNMKLRASSHLKVWTQSHVSVTWYTFNKNFVWHSHILLYKFKKYTKSIFTKLMRLQRRKADSWRRFDLNLNVGLRDNWMTPQEQYGGFLYCFLFCCLNVGLRW